jgi:predicted membrane-bound mannosyltransferase
MEQSVVSWLGQVGWNAFVWSLGGLILLNGAAIALWIWRKDRDLVHRYVAPWLAANALLIMMGVGVPAVASAGRLIVLATSNSAPVSAFRTLATTSAP